MSILERLQEPRVRIEHITEDELRWLGIEADSDAKPDELTDLGLLRQDLDIECLGGENVRAVKIYRRDKPDAGFITQTLLPNRTSSVASSSDAIKIAQGEVNIHCQRDCAGGNVCLKRAS